MPSIEIEFCLLRVPLKNEKYFNINNKPLFICVGKLF